MFCDAQLGGMRGTWIDLVGSNLQRAHLENAYLVDANLAKTNFEWAHLNGASLTNADLKESHLEAAHFDHADLKGINLVGANLTQSHLDGADLSGARLMGARLSEASLVGTDITDANLSGADLSGVDFTRLRLSPINRLRSMSAMPTGLASATLDGAIYSIGRRPTVFPKGFYPRPNTMFRVDDKGELLTVKPKIRGEHSKN